MQQPAIELCKVRAYPAFTVSPDREPRLKNWKPRVFSVQMDLGTFLFVLFQVAGRQPGDGFGSTTHSDKADKLQCCTNCIIRREAEGELLKNTQCDSGLEG
jgi:hypothetical protein